MMATFKPHSMASIKFSNNLLNRDIHYKYTEFEINLKCLSGKQVLSAHPLNITSNS